MAAVQFELSGDTIVQGTMSETAGGVLLCVLTLPACFVAAHEISLRLTCEDFLIHRSVRLPGSQHRHDTAQATASVLLSQSEITLRLDDVLGHHLTLDAIDAEDRTLEVSGVLPQPVVGTVDCLDDELLFMNGKFSGQPPEVPNFGNPSNRPPSSQPHSDIAKSAAVSLARLYDDEMDDTFILREPLTGS